jgi:hypothetical protein
MEDCTMSIMDVSYGKILAKIDFVWKNRARIKASLQKRIPELQENTRKAVQEALTFGQRATQSG